jgi:hypothetical protein
VRVADEIVVDLMARACGVDYQAPRPMSKRSTSVELRFRLPVSKR